MVLDNNLKLCKVMAKSINFNGNVTHVFVGGGGCYNIACVSIHFYLLSEKLLHMKEGFADSRKQVVQIQVMKNGVNLLSC